MNCEDLTLQLVEAATGEGAPDAEAKAHLEGCAACREKAEDMRRFVAVLRLAGRQERERSERKKRETLARMRAEFARQDREEAGRVEERPGVGPSAPVARRRRIRPLVVAFPFAAAAGLYLALTLAREPRFVPPTREEAAKGWIEVASGNWRRWFPLAHATVWGEPGCAFRVRVWESEAAFEAGEDMRVKEWAVAAGLLGVGWPIVEVHVKEGTALLDNASGRVRVGPGARAFAAPSWLPLVKEAGEASPRLATIEGIVEGVAGAVAVEAYDLGDRFPEEDWKPVRRAPVDEYSQFSLPLLCGRAYLIVPRAGEEPLSPDRVAVVVAGEDPNPGGSEPNGRAEVPLDVGVATHRVEAGGSVRTTLALRKAGILEGTVRDGAGKPVPGAKVRIRARGTSGLLFGREVETGADGSFRAPGISGRFRAEATGEGGLRARAEGNVEAGATATLEFTLAPLGPVVGLVVDTEGRPLEGARVWAKTTREWEAGPWDDRTGDPSGPFQVTAADGSFRIDSGLEPEPSRLFAEADPSHGGWSDVLDPRGGRSGIRIAARRTLSIEGSVADEGSRPLAARLHVKDPGSGRMLRSCESSEQSGRFAFRHLEPGRYILEAWAPGFRLARREIALASTSEGADFLLSRETRAVRVKFRRPDGESLLAPEAAMPAAEDWARVRAGLDVRAVFLKSDPRAAEGPVSPEEMLGSWQRSGEPGDLEIPFPDGTDRAWVVLQVCGRIEEAREVRVGDEVLFRVDLPAAAMEVGGLRILGQDAETGEAVPLLSVEALHDGRGIPWTLHPFRGEAFGPLRAGEYEVEVGADGYPTKRMGRVRIEPGEAAGPFTVALRRER